MAKRKRLSPAPAPGPSEAAPETKALNGWVGVRARAPIADVSGAAAAQSALEEVAGELRRAKAEGRMVTKLPLEAVDAGHLVRDRMVVDAEDMAVLTDSLRARGQQTPIEVVDLGQGRYGLISGWRRLMALRTLQQETGEARFGLVQALIRAPKDASEAYCAMVEENEIRADLSFYERANMAVQAAEQGVYSDPKEAIQTLFSAARAPKRSKIVAFSRLVGALGDVLRFPTRLPEKLGLALVRQLDQDPKTRARLRAALQAAEAEDWEAERAVLERSLKAGAARASPAAAAPVERLAPGLSLQARPGTVRLSGPGADAALIADLRRWLARRAGNA